MAAVRFAGRVKKAAAASRFATSSLQAEKEAMAEAAERAEAEAEEELSQAATRKAGCEDGINRFERMLGVDLDGDGDVGAAGSRRELPQAATRKAGSEGGINRFERMLGVDLDGDGDVGAAGNPRDSQSGDVARKGSKVESTINRMERMLGVDLDGDGDVGVAGRHNVSAKVRHSSESEDVKAKAGRGGKGEAREQAKPQDATSQAYHVRSLPQPLTVEATPLAMAEQRTRSPRPALQASGARSASRRVRSADLRRSAPASMLTI